MYLFHRFRTIPLTFRILPAIWAPMVDSSVTADMPSFINRVVGILALQGDYERHADHVTRIGAQPVLVRKAETLDGLDALILPGGESTTMSTLIDRFEMRQSLVNFCREHPVYATCAGMILLSKEIVDNQAGVVPFGLLDISVRRNGWGRQINSFDTELTISGNGLHVVRGSFIRAPKIVRVGADVRVISTHQREPVLVEQGNILAASFHAELGEDTRLLTYFLKKFLADRAA